MLDADDDEGGHGILEVEVELDEDEEQDLDVEGHGRPTSLAAPNRHPELVSGSIFVKGGTRVRNGC